MARFAALPIVSGSVSLLLLISVVLIRYEKGVLEYFVQSSAISNMQETTGYVTTAAESAYHYHGGKDETYPSRFELHPGRPAVALNYKRQWQLVSTKLKLTMTFVPKVMSSSIRDALAKIQCGDPEKRCVEVRMNKPLSAVDVTNYTSVIFMRDPFERALSAYSNAQNNHYIFVDNCSETRKCSFEQWIESIYTNRKIHFVNEHFRPQRTIMQLSKMHYHYYLRMSSPIDQDFFWHTLLQLKKAYASNVSHKQRNATTNKNATQQESASAAFLKAKAQFAKLTTETIRRMADIWATDLILWQQFHNLGTPRQPGEYTMYDYYTEHWLPQFEKRQEALNATRRKRRKRRKHGTLRSAVSWLVRADS